MVRHILSQKLTLRYSARELVGTPTYSSDMEAQGHASHETTAANTAGCQRAPASTPPATKRQRTEQVSEASTSFDSTAQLSEGSSFDSTEQVSEGSDNDHHQDLWQQAFGGAQADAQGCDEEELMEMLRAAMMRSSTRVLALCCYELWVRCGYSDEEINLAINQMLYAAQ